MKSEKRSTTRKLIEQATLEADKLLETKELITHLGLNAGILGRMSRCGIQLIASEDGIQRVKECGHPLSGEIVANLPVIESPSLPCLLTWRERLSGKITSLFGVYMFRSNFLPLSTSVRRVEDSRKGGKTRRNI